jgi:hypothetical protein
MPHACATHPQPSTHSVSTRPRLVRHGPTENGVAVPHHMLLDPPERGLLGALRPAHISHALKLHVLLLQAFSSVRRKRPRHRPSNPSQRRPLIRRSRSPVAPRRHVGSVIFHATCAQRALHTHIERVVTLARPCAPPSPERTPCLAMAARAAQSRHRGVS